MSRSNLLVTILFCAVILSSPLQWQRIASLGGLTVGSFHLFSFLFCLSVLTNKGFLQSARIHRISGFCVALFLYFLLLTTVSMSDSGHYNLRDFVRQSFYIATAMSVSIFLSVKGFRFRNANMVVCFISLTPFLLVYLMWTAINETSNPALILYSAFMQRDPDLLIHHIFKAVINSGEDNVSVVQANLRHQIVGAILAAIFFNVTILMANKDFIGRVTRLIFLASIFLSVFIIIASMSRSILLSGFLAVIVYLMFSFRINAKSILFFILFILAVILIIFSPIGEMLYVRTVGNTASYDARLGFSSIALESINKNILFGTLSETQSPHNLIIDFWMSFGLFGLISSLFLIGSIVVASYKTGIVGFRTNSFILKMSCIALCLPLVRWLTASKGQLSFPEWICVGLVLACVMYKGSEHKFLNRK